MQGRYKILVYGCQMNIADAERMEGQLQAAGYARTEETANADIILINTCCVPEPAEDQVYGQLGEVKKIKEKNPKLIFGIAGCMAQKEGDNLMRRAPHIDFVLGTGKVQELTRIIAESRAEHSPVVDVALSDSEIAEDLPVARGGKFSAWVPIMYGCNNYCTYCIVPYVRGRERSRAPEEVVAEVRRAVAEGYREVTLLGQNVNSYGKDHKEADFADLLRMVDGVEGIRRVRFMTSHPKDISDKLIDTIKSGAHICEHIHLPVQYGSSRLLKAMNRGYTVEKYRERALRVREALPEASLTTDLIVGFPGETEEDFAQMLAFLREMRYDSAYTFLYSKRSGTPAATMANQVADDVKHARLNRLMEEQNAISRAINERLMGAELEIMVEGASKNDPRVWSGRTRTNKIVLFPHGAEREGDFVRVKINQPQTWLLKGEVVS